MPIPADQIDPDARKVIRRLVKHNYQAYLVGGYFGTWLDPEQNVGLEANYMSLANRSVTQSVRSTGLPGSPSYFVPYIANDGTNAVDIGA